MTREQLLPQGLLQTIPPLYANENISTDDAIIKAKYFIANFTWLVTECEIQDDDVLFFGYVINHDTPEFSEWGYFTLNQLLEVKLLGFIEVERDLYFKECKFSDYNSTL